jgi:DNA-binding IclR family transcriptional regulator
MRISTIGATFEIIETLADSNGMSVSELAKQINKPPSTTHDYLSSLVEVGYVYKRDREYHASLKFLRLSETIRGSRNTYTEARSVIREAANELPADFLLGVEEAGEYVVLDWGKGAEDVDFGFYQGLRLPLYATAAGKVLLASMDGDQLDDFLENLEFRQHTPNTVVDLDEFRTELEQIRDEGVAYNDQEFAQGISAVAVPIEASNEPSATIAAVAPSRRVDEEEFRTEAANKLNEIANIVEISLSGPVG